MMFYKRDSGVIEIQQSRVYEENPNDACRNFDVNTADFVTLTSKYFLFVLNYCSYLYLFMLQQLQ